MATDNRVVECSTHGTRSPAFVCQHLNLYDAIGFVEAYDPDSPDDPQFQAWCSACDEVFMAEGEWNDVSEAFAKPRLICSACFVKMRELNHPPGPSA